MKRALLVAYYFPPLGHSGVMRAVQLHRLLPQYGYACDILTVKPVLYWAYAPELLRDCRPDDIFRSGSYDKQRLLYALGVRQFPKAGRGLIDSRPIRAFPDNKTGWISPAVRLGQKLIMQRSYDVIISTSPPISGHLIAERLHDHTGLPWVADFRDPWWSAPLQQVYRDQVKHAEGRALLQRIRDKAAAVISVSRSIADEIRTACVVPNGFDPQHALEWRAPEQTSPLTIGLLGTFDKTLPVWPLAATLREFAASWAGSVPALRIVQVGHTDKQWLERVLEEHGVSVELECHGIRNRRDSIQLLNRCHLFYVGYEQQGSYSLLPGRMPDLAVSGRPILAYASTESEISRFLREVPESFCFDRDSIQAAANWLGRIEQVRLRGELKIVTQSERYAYLSWDARVNEFAHVLDDVS